MDNKLIMMFSCSDNSIGNARWSGIDTTSLNEFTIKLSIRLLLTLSMTCCEDAVDMAGSYSVIRPPVHQCAGLDSGCLFGVRWEFLLWTWLPHLKECYWICRSKVHSALDICHVRGSGCVYSSILCIFKGQKHDTDTGRGKKEEASGCGW